jgi:hypothetical protein
VEREISHWPRPGSAGPMSDMGQTEKYSERADTAPGRCGTAIAVAAKSLTSFGEPSPRLRCRSLIENHQPRFVSATLAPNTGPATARAPSSPDRNAGGSPRDQGPRRRRAHRQQALGVIPRANPPRPSAGWYDRASALRSKGRQAAGLLGFLPAAAPGSSRPSLKRRPVAGL